MLLCLCVQRAAPEQPTVVPPAASARRHGCEHRPPYTCRDECEALEREMAPLQRRHRAASWLRAALRSPSVLERRAGASRARIALRPSIPLQIAISVGLEGASDCSWLLRRRRCWDLRRRNEYNAPETLQFSAI